MALALTVLGPGALAQRSGGESRRSAASIEQMTPQISPNHRYLVDQRGEPFLYLADTAWTLFRRLDRSEADEYLRNRVAKGFTVIQAYLLRGLDIPNRNGDLTLIDRNPAKPNEDWFKHADYIVNRANELGLVMAIVASKGDHVKQRQWPVSEAVFNEENAFGYGRFLGNRYRSNAVIWYLGGDTAPVEPVRTVWIAMARGLKEGSQGRHLVSYHGPGPGPGPKDYSSSFWFHGEDWLDFNVIQSGHRWFSPNFQFVAHDYALTPVKPTIDMEATYENHAPDRNQPDRRIGARQVREKAYWNLLSGAAGHGYGCNDIFQFYDPASPPGRKDYTFPFYTWSATTHWRAAMDFPGSQSMGILRKLFESRPWHLLMPDNSLIAAGQGENENHVQAAIASDASFLFAYLPYGNPVTIRMDRIKGRRVKAQWFDPRNGTWKAIGRYAARGTREFAAPSRGEQDDWVLVLDSAK